MNEELAFWFSEAGRLEAENDQLRKALEEAETHAFDLESGEAYYRLQRRLDLALTMLLERGMKPSEFDAREANALHQQEKP